MEISGGIARGTLLEVPYGMDVRPTSIRARRALFDSLGDLTGKRICDLFAGSGALGLEAVSRGAETLVSVEEAASSVAVIRKNIRNVSKRTGKDPDKIKVIQGKLPECMRVLAGNPPADIIFADPPYARSMELASQILADKDFLDWSQNSLLIWELPESRTLFQQLPPEKQILDIKKYGSIRFMFIGRK